MLPLQDVDVWVRGLPVQAGAQLLERVGPDMVIRHEKPIRGHKLARPAAVETDARLLEMRQPGLTRVEAIFLHQQGPRGMVVKPHALVRRKAGGGPRQHADDARKNCLRKSELHGRIMANPGAGCKRRNTIEWGEYPISNQRVPVLLKGV